MKLVLSVFLSFSFLLVKNSFGQSLVQLDAKNGFKYFSLNDLYSKWQNQLQFKQDLSDDTRTYYYTGQCCQKLFKYKVDRIILRFSGNKLMAIHIRL